MEDDQKNQKCQTKINSNWKMTKISSNGRGQKNQNGRQPKKIQ